MAQQSELSWSLKCLICGFCRCSLVPMQEHAMHTHCRTLDDLRAARRREVPGGYMFRGEYLDASYVWTFPDGVDWLSAQKANVIIRGWSGGVLAFEDGVYIEPVAVDRVTTGPLIYEMVERHAALLGAVHMIEFEFPELPESERFLRFGTDKTGIVDPVALARPGVDWVGSQNPEKSCPRCGSADFLERVSPVTALDRVTDPAAAHRLICQACGLVYLPELRDFYKGLEK